MRIGTAFSIALLAVIFITPKANAVSISPIGTTVISGTIQNPDIHKLGVAISCTHNGKVTTHNTVMNLKGKYVTIFSLRECSDGDFVTVKGSNGTSGSGVVHDNNPRKVLEINVGRINASVPEFSLWTMLATLGLCSVSFLVIRKRYALSF